METYPNEISLLQKKLNGRTLLNPVENTRVKEFLNKILKELTEMVKTETLKTSNFTDLFSEDYLEQLEKLKKLHSKCDIIVFDFTLKYQENKFNMSQSILGNFFTITRGSVVSLHELNKKKLDHINQLELESKKEDWKKNEILGIVNTNIDSFHKLIKQDVSGVIDNFEKLIVSVESVVEDEKMKNKKEIEKLVEGVKIFVKDNRNNITTEIIAVKDELGLQIMTVKDEVNEMEENNKSVRERIKKDALIFKEDNKKDLIFEREKLIKHVVGIREEISIEFEDVKDDVNKKITEIEYELFLTKNERTEVLKDITETRSEVLENIVKTRTEVKQDIIKTRKETKQEISKLDENVSKQFKETFKNLDRIDNSLKHEIEIIDNEYKIGIEAIESNIKKEVASILQIIEKTKHDFKDQIWCVKKEIRGETSAMKKIKNEIEEIYKNLDKLIHMAKTDHGFTNLSKCKTLVGIGVFLIIYGLEIDKNKNEIL
jgi:hypothetical protein